MAMAADGDGDTGTRIGVVGFVINNGAPAVAVVIRAVKIAMVVVLEFVPVAMVVAVVITGLSGRSEQRACEGNASDKHQSWYIHSVAFHKVT